MAGITGKTPSATYKDLLKIENTNNGVDDTLRQIESGDGTGSALYIEKNSTKIMPTDDDTALLDVQDKSGSSKFKVDTTNDLVYALGHKVNTQFAYFAANSTSHATFSANTHHPIGFQNAVRPTTVSIGTGTDPDTSYTISSTADDLTNSLMYLPANITVESVNVFLGADASSGDTTRFHLMSYDIDTANGSTGGDLSNGTVIADGADISGDGYEQIYYQSMTVQSADVNSGKVLLFIMRSDSVNSDYAVHATVKYTLR